jgi:hypothetical protein
VSAAGDHAEVVVGQAHDREVGAEATGLVEDRGVDDAADLHVGLGDDDVLHRGQRLGADDVEDDEGRQVDQARGLAHLQVLGVDDRRPPARVPLVLARHARVAELLDEPGVRLVPERALPAGGLVEHRAELALGGVHGGQADVAVALVLLAGVHDAVGLDERLGGARLDVRPGLLVRVEARDVGVAEVDLGVAVRHPLGDGAGGARTLLDPHRGGGPQALDLGRLTEDRVAVGGQREQAVDGVADLGALVAEELGHELERLLELRVEVVLGERQLGGGELALLDGGDVLGSQRMARWA